MNSPDKFEDIGTRVKNTAFGGVIGGALPLVGAGYSKVKKLPMFNNDSSNLNRNIGTHLADAEMWHKTPALMGEYGNPILLGSVSEQQGGHQQ